MDYKIYHNPRCSKSRQTLAILNEKGVKLEVYEYLKDAPSEIDIYGLIRMLGFTSVRALMRTGETIYKDLHLKDVDDDDILVKAMAEHPILIERPILIRGNKAVIGRPPENVLALL